VFTGLVFVGHEVLLDVGFDAAAARLAGLVHSGALLTASHDAYGEGIAGLARVGPLGPARGVSKLVEVQLREPVTHGDSMTLALRWEAAGPGSGLFPVLDADVTLAAAGEDATVLRLDAVYRLPFGALGAGLDRAILHRVASATVGGFVGRLGEAITRPAPVTGPVGGERAPGVVMPAT
jgi:hypothetical protein